MKVRNKGKVHPSPSASSSSSSYSPNDDIFSVLKLLPTAIFALVSILSLEDREVLAYMITRSLKSTNPSSTSSSSSLIDGKKKNNSNNKSKKKSSSSNNQHKPPVFDCECFDCYTSYWFRWDSSSNRELIHQAIEAFEEHLNNGEQSKRNHRGKKRDKISRRQFVEKAAPSPGISTPDEEPTDLTVLENDCAQLLPDNVEEEVLVVMEADEVLPEEDVPSPEMEAVVRSTAAVEHKGLARKVLPDVLGLFNSRLWNLWSPNA